MKTIIIGEHSIIIDDDLFDRCSQYSWIVYKATNTGVHYAKAKLHKHYSAPVFLHRFVGHIKRGWPLNKDKMHIDHINGNGLDCRIENLSYISPRENILKAKLKCKPSSTGLKGIYYNKLRRKYSAEYFANYKKHYIGLFDSIDEAVKARTLYIDQLTQYGNE